MRFSLQLHLKTHAAALTGNFKKQGLCPVNHDSQRTIRILISSPGDVAEERDRARQVIEGLRRRYAGSFHLKPVLWEELALQTDMSFQEGIDLLLSQDHGIDIAIFILWSRLGSVVGPRIRKPDGSDYLSGTERELDLMLRARHHSGGIRPAILTYTRNDETCFEERLRGQPTAEKEELVAQKKQVELFIVQNFQDQSSGVNTRAFHTFDRPVKFSQRLRVHLTALLDQIAGNVTETIWDIEKQGPPFLGLNSFQPEHADIFFGREEEILEIRLSLRERARQGCAFLLLTGSSGSGKSSLARAGVLPDIVQNELDDTVVAWRSLIITPAQLNPDPLSQLLQKLAHSSVLPEIQADTLPLNTVARGLRENPELTWNLVIRPAFDQLAAQVRGKIRLLLIIDQMEEIFATHVMTPSDREAFLKVIEIFATSGLVWVLATARSDFYHQIQSEQALVRVLQGRGPMLVTPPAPDALQRLIEEPARLSGMRFEERDGFPLSRRIFRDAAAHAELLPLLEFVLRELYESSDKEKKLLTVDSYEKLGGLEGAIGRQAEAAFNTLPVDSQAALADLLPLLVTLELAGEQSAVRRRANLDDLRQTPAKRRLTECLIERRFLTADRQNGEPVAVFTHEALLRRWDRISTWINANREYLRIRARVLAAVINWEKHERRSDLLLSGGKPLDDANELVESGMTLESTVLEFIEQSRRKVRRSHRLRQTAIGSLLALTVLSILSTALAWYSQGEAQRAMLTAENREQEAIKSQIELKQQIYDSTIAIAEREISQNHDIGKASALLEGEDCPKELRGWEWNYLMRLRDGPREPLLGHKTGLWGAEFSPDGNVVATCSIDGTLRIWNAENGSLVRTIEADKIDGISKLLALFKLPRIPIMCLAFSPDGTKIATGSFLPRPQISLLDPLHPKPDRDSPGLVRVWDVDTGKLLSSFQDQKGVVLSLAFSPDGKQIASSSINPDNSFVVWDADSGNVIKRITGHKSHLHRLRFSPDGRFIAAGETDGTVKLWNSDTFEETLHIDAHTAPVVGISFEPTQQKRMATAGEDGLVRVWNVNTGEKILELEGHAGAALDVRYSPDGTRIASSGFDKTIRVWEANSGTPKITLRGHTELVWSISFSPDSKRLVSASFDNSARIWDATERSDDSLQGEFAVNGHTERVNSVSTVETSDNFVSGGWDKSLRIWNKKNGQMLATLEGHNATVWCVTMSPDGQKVASASWDHTAKVWDIKTGRELLTFKEHTAPVHCIAFSADGTRLATGAFDGQMKIWDAETGSVIASCDGFIFPVMAVAFSPDGKFVASGGSDRSVKIWESNSGRPLMSLSGHTASIHSLAYSHDGQQLASASWDHTVRLWNVSQAESSPASRILHVIDGHEDRVNAVVYSPDGSCIATASEDKTVRIWDAQTATEIAPRQRHRAVVWSVAFANKGKSLLSAGWDKSSWIRSWHLKPLTSEPPPATEPKN